MKHFLFFEYQRAGFLAAFSSLTISFHSLSTDPVLEVGVIGWYHRTYLALFNISCLVLTSHGLNHGINCSPESSTRDTLNSLHSHGIFSTWQPELIISKM